MNTVAAFLNSTPAARTVTIVLLAGLAGLTTDAFLKLAYGKPAPAAQAASTTSSADKPTPQWLAGGDAAQAAAPSDIKLLGVVAQGNEGRLGYALIQAAGKRAQVLHVGQSMADGTQLLRVQGKTATLNMNGQPRVFTLEAASGSATSVATAVNNAIPAAPQAYTPAGVDSAAQMAHLQQLQLLQQAAAAQSNTNTTETGSPPVADPNLSGQIRRRMGRP